MPHPVTLHMDGAHGGAGMPTMDMMGGVLVASLLVCGLLIAVAVYAGWWLAGRNREVDDARHDLDVRYACGQLDRDTYLRIRADLGTRSR